MWLSQSLWTYAGVAFSPSPGMDQAADQGAAGGAVSLEHVRGCAGRVAGRSGSAHGN